MQLPLIGQIAASNASVALVVLAFALNPTRAQTCSYPAGFQFEEGGSLSPAPNFPAPARGAWFRDSLTGACMVRATDFAVDGLTSFQTIAHPDEQVFNADNSMYFAQDEKLRLHVYAMETLRPIKVLSQFNYRHPQWHPSDPDRLYFLPGDTGLVLDELTISTGKTRTVANFARRHPWGDSTRLWLSGTPSANARYWSFEVHSNDGSNATLGLISYDLATDSILGTYSGPGRNDLNLGPRIKTISPTGKYVILSRADTDDRLFAYTLDFSDSIPVPHCDEMALSAEGHDLCIFMTFQVPPMQNIPVYTEAGIFDLQTRREATLFSLSIASNSGLRISISGRGLLRPGWAIVSASGYDSSKVNLIWNNKVSALELKANPRMYALAHCNPSSWDNLSNPPTATVSRDFTRILFNSNWGAAHTLNGLWNSSDAYLIQIPGNAFASSLIREVPGPGAEPGWEVRRSDGDAWTLRLPREPRGRFRLEIFASTGSKLWETSGNESSDQTVRIPALRPGYCMARFSASGKVVRRRIFLPL
jgi:hypothetical protein